MFRADHVVCSVNVDLKYVYTFLIIAEPEFMPGNFLALRVTLIFVYILSLQFLRLCVHPPLARKIA